MREHYYTTPMFKMGVWSLLPADSMSWHGLESSLLFKEEFGFGKGLLMIHDMKRDEQLAYIPISFFDKIKTYISTLKEKNTTALAEKLTRFYTERARMYTALAAYEGTNYSSLSTEALINIYTQNRHCAHYITVWDQFGWLGENVFDTDMQTILESKGLTKGTPEYHAVLFTLTKPHEISTTLAEKRDALQQALEVKKGTVRIEDAAQTLFDAYAWMPVFAYGTPWDVAYFTAEIQGLLEKSEEVLESEYTALAEYAQRRDSDFADMVRTYDLSDEEAQVFVDFGLMLDTRNEAEYVLSFAGYHVLPLYTEIAKRLALSVKQVRSLTEEEIIDCLREKTDPQILLNNRRRYCTWGFNDDMTEIYFYSEEEAEKLLAHVEAHAEGFKGPREGVGICASSGTVQGTAKIVMSPSENDKVQEGDILITQSTTVDYLPAMKRAAAFVTEVGGLTCHAAVVAREFGVPCVVSLPGATKMYADGDAIEVRADEGIVAKRG